MPPFEPRLFQIMKATDWLFFGRCGSSASGRVWAGAVHTKASELRLPAAVPGAATTAAPASHGQPHPALKDIGFGIRPRPRPAPKAAHPTPHTPIPPHPPIRQAPQQELSR